MGGFLSKSSKNDKKKKENVESDKTTPRSEQGGRDAENRRRENIVTSNPGREGVDTSAPTQGRGNSDPEKSAGTSSSSGNEGTTSQGQENNTAKGKREPERRDENSSSPSGDNAKQEDTKTNPPPSSAALPEGRESEGTSTSTHDQGNTEPENPASPSSKPLIEGGEEDQAKNTTPEDGGEKSRDKDGAEAAPTSGTRGNGDTTAQGPENNTTTEEKKGGGRKPSSSQSGEHAQLKTGSGVTVTSTPGPGDPGTSTPTPHDLETTKPGEMSDPSSLRTTQHRSGEKTPSSSSDHGRDPTSRIPDSVPPPQPQGGVTVPPVIPLRKGKATGAETEPREPTRAVIFSLEEDDGVKSLEKWTRSFIPDCQHISPTTTKDWRAAVETSAIVIVYSSSSSYRSFTEKMGQYMDHWKGYEKVIVVIGDVPASEDAVKSGWDGGRWPRCEVHVFTKTERRWILQDPRMQKMSGKIREIREIVLRDYKNKKISVKILSLSGNPELQKPEKKETPWLVPLLRDDEKVDFTFCQISEIKKLPSKLKESGPICILLFTKETFQKINEEKKNSDQQYTMKLKGAGQKHLSVVVVVDDLDDESSENDVRSLYNKSGYSSLWSLFLFRREERRPEYRNYVSSEVTAKEKWRKLQESMESRMRRPESCDTPDATPRPPPADNEDDTRTPGNLGVAGIFSRSSNTDYSWMETVLKSPDLALVVSEVRPFYISNNQTVKFYEELGRCSFGILYHTKNRGRVNVTDVTDSLYDEELEAMSQILKRENVIVVIDDLRDSHTEEKERILKTQPSIDRYAFDLLLFSEQDKKDGEHIVKLTEAIKLLVAGKKTSGTSNSRKNQPQINGNNIDNPEEQSTDNSNITSISTPL